MSYIKKLFITTALTGWVIAVASYACFIIWPSTLFQARTAVAHLAVAVFGEQGSSFHPSRCCSQQAESSPVSAALYNKETIPLQDQIAEWMAVDSANRESLREWLKDRNIGGSEALWLVAFPKESLTAAMNDLGIPLRQNTDDTDD